MSQPAIKLYRVPLSGHAHRVELMLSLLQLPTELVFVDMANGAHKKPEFLAINAFGTSLIKSLFWQILLANFLASIGLTVLASSIAMRRYLKV